TVSGTANTIAFNVGSGVAVASGTGNALLGNAIFSNDRIGIDLEAPGDPANGVTPPQLVPTPGPNDLVNAPVIGFASSDGKSHTSVVGTFLGVSGGTYLRQFFSSPTADPTGHGQGKTYLGSIDVVLTGNNPSQLVTTGFDAELKVNVAAGQ